MWKNVISDLWESITLYLPMGIAIGGITASSVYIKKKVCNQSVQKDKLGMTFLIVTYFVCIIEIALLSREPGSRNRVDLRLFSTWGKDSISRAYVIENIIMFLPFGIIISYFKNRKWYQCLLAGGMVSLLLEGIQLITQRGYFQIDDIVMNILGTLAGWILGFIGNTISFWINEEKREVKNN